jgi:hypothetical protein
MSRDIVHLWRHVVVVGQVTSGTQTGAGRRRDGPAGGRIALLGERAGDDWISRRITTNGVISVAWQEISCGKHRAGRQVDIHL